MPLRATLKRAIKCIFLLLALPFFGLFLLITAVTGSDASFASFSQWFSLIPGKAGVYFRAAFYRLACPSTSDEISIGFLTILSHRNTTIARGVYIGPQCNIGMCQIGENTLIGSGVHILSGNRQHDFSDVGRPIQEQGGEYQKVSIGKDCWVGNASILMGDLADHSILASGGVLTKRSLTTGEILAGNPAQPKRNRFQLDDNVEGQIHEKPSA
ncbi:acyltransferase [Marinobacter sp.]|uniref:acyltransferase n=1 Tax=Marinobacter sp. TaxID=50741 RepID=UPI0038513961